MIDTLSRTSPPKLRIVIPTAAYNPRRDGKPWVCRVVAWPAGGASRPEIEWGSWFGQPGSAGELVVFAEVGDVLRHGQNDLRRANHTYRQYLLVAGADHLVELSDAEAARICQASDPRAVAETHLAGLAELSSREAASPAIPLELPAASPASLQGVLVHALTEAGTSLPHSADCVRVNAELAEAVAGLDSEDRYPGDTDYRCCCAHRLIANALAAVDLAGATTDAAD